MAVVLEFEPLSPGIGVRVRGLDLGSPIAEETALELQAALKRHRILLFREGPLGEEQHIGIMRALGNVIVEAPGADSPVSWVSTTPGDYVGGTFKILWHSDGQFTRTGALQAISLNAIEMERDEPTLFADQVRAAKALPADLRARVQDLKLLQCIDLSGNDERSRCRLSGKPADVPLTQFVCTEHPLLGRHPFTGEDMINVSQFFTSHVVGLSDEESDALFAELEPIQYDPDFIFAHHWQLNDLLIWDNVGLQHAREALGGASGRRLRRVSINPLDNKELMAGVKPAASRRLGTAAEW